MYSTKQETRRWKYLTRCTLHDDTLCLLCIAVKRITNDGVNYFDLTGIKWISGFYCSTDLVIFVTVILLEQKSEKRNKMELKSKLVYEEISPLISHELNFPEEQFFLSFRVNVSGLHDEKQRINVFWVVLCIFRSQFSLLNTKENLLFLGNREKCEKFLFRLSKIETLVMNYWWGLYLLCTWMEINFFFSRWNWWWRNEFSENKKSD